MHSQTKSRITTIKTQSQRENRSTASGNCLYKIQGTVQHSAQLDPKVVLFGEEEKCYGALCAEMKMFCILKKLCSP